ncbi:MAG: hypothetical protein Q8O37_05775 [Sulfuricellaceae bacterium]|nr:hypothetical protein [Sulfuricellaceae bacterium]
MRVGNVNALSVKYTIKILDPHPFLFKPESSDLGLPTLSKDTGNRQTPRLTTLMFSSQGKVVEADPSFRYGKWVNEK